MAITNSTMNYVSPVPIPPGETLKETLAEKGMTRTDLALRTGRPLKTISEIIAGKTAITADTASQFEYALNIPAYFWLNLESAYQTAKVRQRERKNVSAESSLAALYPFSEMAKLGWVTVAKTAAEKVQELKRFFGVSSLKNVKAVEATAFRKAEAGINSNHALAAWLRKGELEAQEIKTADYDEAAFRKAFTDIKRLAYEMPQDFSVRLRDICRACGVAVVYVPHLKHTHVNGATRWLAPEKALIQLSIRYPFEDVFWFSFFHEAGHILLHGKREIFIDYKTMDGSQKEEEANRFAQNALIGPDEYRTICKASPFSKERLLSLSETLCISSGVIVGRLLREGAIEYSRFGNMRTKLVWKH